LGETSSIPPFSGRKSGPAKVNVSIVLKHLPIASFPAKDVSKLVDTMKEMYPSVAPATNVLETILSDLNLVGHPAAALLNTGRIEYTGPFRLWREGVTPSVAKLIEAVDKERLAVMKALDLKNVETYVEMSKHWGMCPQDVNGYQEAINKKYIAPTDPTDVKTHRYISEDIPYSLVTCASIGDMINVDTPVMKAIIKLFSAMNEINYWKEGRTAETLGISGLSLKQLQEYVNEGVLRS
jgi:opine dehydrogenase